MKMIRNVFFLSLLCAPIATMAMMSRFSPAARRVAPTGARAGAGSWLNNYNTKRAAVERAQVREEEAHKRLLQANQANYDAHTHPHIHWYSRAERKHLRSERDWAEEEHLKTLRDYFKAREDFETAQAEERRLKALRDYFKAKEDFETAQPQAEPVRRTALEPSTIKDRLQGLRASGSEWWNNPAAAEIVEKEEQATEETEEKPYVDPEERKALEEREEELKRATSQLEEPTSY